VTRPGRNRRLVWRLTLYIKALGGIPNHHTGQHLPTYVAELQRQYQRLREELGPEACRASRIAVRAAIRKYGLARAASEFACSDRPNLDNVRGPVAEQKQQNSPSRPLVAMNLAEPASVTSRRELSNCRRKLRHTNFLSALLHASQLRDDDLLIYPCPLCDGLHVGHDPERKLRRYRKIVAELRSLQRRLQELEHKRVRLLVRRSELIAERDLAGHKEETPESLIE
jgi:hypothetical protein